MQIRGHRVSVPSLNLHIGKRVGNLISRLASHFTGVRNNNQYFGKSSPTKWHYEKNPPQTSAANAVKTQENHSGAPSREYCIAIKNACQGIRQMANDGNMYGEFRVSPQKDQTDTPSKVIDLINQTDSKGNVATGVGALLKKFVKDQCAFTLETGNGPGQGDVFMQLFQQKLESLHGDVKEAVLEVLATCGEVLIRHDTATLKEFDTRCITMLCDSIAVIPVNKDKTDQAWYTVSQEGKTAFANFCKALAAKEYGSESIC